MQVLWAVQYPAYSIISEALSAATLSFWTFVLALAALLPALLLELRRRRAPAGRRAMGPDLVRFALLAAGGFLPPSILLAWGIAHSSASNGAILMLTTPVFMALLGMLMFRERPGVLIALSLASAGIGTAIISWQDIRSSTLGSAALLGNAAILAAALGTAFFNGYSKRLLERYSALEVLFYGCLAAALECAVVSLLTDAEPFYRTAAYSGRMWAGLAVLGMLSWGLATWLWIVMLGRLELVQISVSVYMLPVFGVLASALTLHEHVIVPQMVGGAVVLLSAYLSTLPEATVQS